MQTCPSEPPQASPQPFFCMFSCHPSVPIRKEGGGETGWLCSLFPLPQCWQWLGLNTKVLPWLDKATSNATTTGTSKLQLTVPSLDRQDLPTQPTTSPSSSEYQKIRTAANRSRGSHFPNLARACAGPVVLRPGWPAPPVDQLQLHLPTI